MNFDGTNINILVAFTAGIITFFASCLLPLVPTYLAYLGGTNKPNTTKQITKFYKKPMFVNGLFFTIGFILVFVLLGATANTIGSVLSVHRAFIQQIGGVIFIVLGLFMLEIIKPMTLLKEHKITTSLQPTKWKKLNALIIGSTFGFAWTPCIGPVLGVILFWASQSDSIVKGISLLFAYGLGMGIPFLLIAIIMENAQLKLSRFNRFGAILQKLSATFIIFVGILLLFDKVYIFTHSVVNLFSLAHLAR